MQNIYKIHVISWDFSRFKFTAQHSFLDEEFIHLQNAKVIIGGKHILTQVKSLINCSEEKIWHCLATPIENSLNFIQICQEQGQRVVVLASGDPLFFGIGVTLVERFGKDKVNIHCGISILQRLCAHFGHPWHEVQSISLHGRDQKSIICAWHKLYAELSLGKAICILTDKYNNPKLIAEKLWERGARNLDLYLVENWGQDIQKFSHFSLEEAKLHEASMPCTVLVIPQNTKMQSYLGIDHSLLQKEQNLISKPVIRSTALSLLALQKDDTFWDIGSGSGAIALEATKLAGQVIAIEKNPSRVEHIKLNRQKFNAFTMDVIHGQAPECLHENLTKPQKIFIGGGLGYGQEKLLLDALCSVLQENGRIVISAVLFGTFNSVCNYFQKKGWQFQCQQIQVNEMKCLGKAEHQDMRFVPQNPVFLIYVQKPV